MFMGENDMNYFFIDYENISGDSINSIEQLKNKDHIIFFYTKQHMNVSLNFLNSLELNCCAKTAITGTKNALDFQLSSYLGYLIGKKSKSSAKYFIVSNDKGYDCLCSFWKNQGIKVERIQTNFNISKLSDNCTLTKTTDNMITEEELDKYLNDNDSPAEVIQIFNRYKTKSAIHNDLEKLFKNNKKASSVYKKLKPLFAEKNKT